ncbi:MAG TPA: aromatic ring-hydroxylating dioxygenase subunit alpha [Gaiella sp.]|jgi:choline monooxygenase
MATTHDVRTLPYDWYVDPSVLVLERESIFGRTWQYVARSDQVAHPGSFVAARAGHVPVVVVRGRDERLRAFVNVCRHRGSLVCEGEGRRESLQCPYHAWTYDLDGSLRAAPRSDREPGFDRDALGLVALAVDTWGPFVFVNPDPDATPLAEHLGELPALLAEGGVDVDRLEFRLRAEADEYACNWKVCVENYLECYHCSVAHPSFSKAIDVTQDAYDLRTHATFSSQLAVARNGGGGVYDAGGEVSRGQFHLLFPNTLINVMPGRLNLSIGPVLPIAPTRAYRYLDYFFAPDVDQAWVEDYLALDTVVGAEDRVLVERVQAGLGSGTLAHGRLLPESERLIAHFQAMVVDALGADGEPRG